MNLSKSLASSLRIRTMLFKFRFIFLAGLLFGMTPGGAMSQDLLTLEKSIVIAKESSLNIEVEKQNIHKQSIDIKRNRADTLPAISLNSDYEQLSGVHTLKDSVDFSWDLSTLAKGSDGPGNFMLKAAEKQKSMVEALLVYRVKAGYYKLMQSKQELILLQKGAKSLLQQRSITQQLVSAQLKFTSALSRIDDHINTTKNQILLKQGEVYQTRSALLQLINIPDSPGIKFADQKKEFVPLPDRSQLMAKALKNDPETQTMIMEKQAVEHSVHPAWMDRLPVVSASAGYQQEWPNSSDGVDFHVVFSFPLLDMGRGKFNNAANSALAAKKQAEIRQKTKGLIDRINMIYERAERYKSFFTAYKKTHSHRLQTLQLIKSEYEAGLISESDLFNINRETVDAEFQMTKFFYEYMTLVAEIDYCKGDVQ